MRVRLFLPAFPGFNLRVYFMGQCEKGLVFLNHLLLAGQTVLDMVVKFQRHPGVAR